MRKAVVARFERPEDAQRAVEGLLAAEFVPTAVRLALPPAGTAVPRGMPEPMADRPVGERIAQALGFGSDAADTAPGSDGRVVTVEVADDGEAARAEQVLDRYDPIDIDQQAAR